MMILQQLKNSLQRIEFKTATYCSFKFNVKGV